MLPSTPRNNEFFNRPVTGYKRTTDLKGWYYRNEGWRLAILNDVEQPFAEKWVKENVPFKKVEMGVLKRLPNKDRAKGKTELLAYLEQVMMLDLVMMPNMHIYDAASQRRSFLSEFILNSLEARKIEKKAEFKAKEIGDAAGEEYHSGRQTVIKRRINSLSGSHASPHNPFYNNTAHTSLTSKTRSGTSYSNLIAERTIGGSRHYTSGDVAVNDMVASISMADQVKIEYVMQKFQLNYPTADVLFSHVLNSLRRYTRDIKQEEKVKTFITKLKPWQLAAAAFSLDLEAVRKTNPKFMRSIITLLASKPSFKEEHATEWLDGVHPYMEAQIAMTISDELEGKSLDTAKEVLPDVWALAGAKVREVEEGLAGYQPFIDAFLMTDYMPCNVWDTPSIIRHNIPLSDTDSTVFTVEDWVIWYLGKNDFTRDGMSVAGAMSYIDVSVLRHILALMSKQVGVEDEHLFRFAMKSEFYQPVVGVANMSKHYCSFIGAREGNVYKQLEFDSKGVGLKSSRINPAIIKGSDDFIAAMFLQAMTGEQTEFENITRIPASWSHVIHDGLLKGECFAMPFGQLRQEDAYTSKDGKPTTFVNYSFWNDIFGPKYGIIDYPPYQCYMATLTIDRPAKLEEWFETLDPSMEKRAREWCAKHGKDKLGAVYLPMILMQDGKIPSELIPFLDVQNMEATIMGCFNAGLEMLGHYIKNSKNSKTVYTTLSNVKYSKLYSREDLVNRTYVEHYGLDKVK